MKSCCARSGIYQCARCGHKYCSNTCAFEDFPNHKKICKKPAIDKESIFKEKFIELLKITALVNKSFMAFTTSMNEHFKKILFSTDLMNEAQLVCTVKFVQCDPSDIYMDVYCMGRYLFGVPEVSSSLPGQNFADIVVPQHDFNFDRIGDAVTLVICGDNYCGLSLQ